MILWTVMRESRPDELPSIVPGTVTQSVVGVFGERDSALGRLEPLQRENDCLVRLFAVPTQLDDSEVRAGQTVWVVWQARRDLDAVFVEVRTALPRATSESATQCQPGTLHTVLRLHRERHEAVEPTLLFEPHIVDVAL